MDTSTLLIYSVLILCISTLLYLLVILFRVVARLRFSEKYNVGKLPRSVRVKKSKKEEHNYFVLKYPYWRVSKKDGTADLRVKNNFINWQISSLYIDGFLLVSKKPYDILDVVKELRLQNIKIDLCREERIKYNKLLRKKEFYTTTFSIQKIVNYYEDNPAGFEKLCAELYRKMGYKAKVTPAVNDGGYDVIISNREIRAIIECKCYSLNSKVGRPAIQKLVGANNTVAANKMIFITTSEFSLPAISYAKEAGVELINGDELLKLLNRYMFVKQQDIHIKDEEWQLEIADLYPYVPADIYQNYFIS